MRYRLPTNEHYVPTINWTDGAIHLRFDQRLATKQNADNSARNGPKKLAPLSDGCPIETGEHLYGP